MRKTASILIVTALIASLLKAPSIDVFKKAARIGNLNLAGKTPSEGTRLLEQKLNGPLYLNLESSSQAVRPKDIGISIDKTKLYKLTERCPNRLIRLNCRSVSDEKFDPNDVIEIDYSKFEPFVEGVEKTAQEFVKNNVISFNDYSFRALSPNARAFVNKDWLNTKSAIADLITSEQPKIAMDATLKDDEKLQERQMQILTQNITKPLLIKYGRTEIYIPEQEIKSFITTEKRDNLTYGGFNDTNISAYLDKLRKKYGTDDVQVLHTDAVLAIKRALLFRAADEQITVAVVLPLQGKPKTNGKLHAKYLEVVKTQQRLYRFENGKLTKTYVVSTGLTWETPPGSYAILGKQRMTISYFGAWYMPYYLPIGTINGYRFGFHAIPYHMDAAGNIYSRDANTMGSPATGGCIQLKEREAKELFDWADIGMPVYIFD